MDEGSRSFIARLTRIFRKNNLSQQDRFEEEMNDLVGYGAESGAIPQSAGEMIRSIVEFSDTVARQIMTPRIAVVGLDLKSTLGGTIDVVKEEGYSRLPVYDGDMDHIVGFLVAKDLLPFWGQDLAQPLPREVVRPITLVPGNKKIGDLLSELRHKKSYLAVVLDEYGGTAGLVTMEDIIEEIVGDIHDEYDEEEEEVVEVSPGTFVATGQAAISDVSDHLGVELPEGDYDTLGGFLTHQVGRVPVEDEKISWGDFLFTIRVADDRKVDSVRIRRLSEKEEDAATEPAA